MMNEYINIKRSEFSKGSTLLKNVIPRDIAYFITHTMLRYHHNMMVGGAKVNSADGVSILKPSIIDTGDTQIPDALTVMYNNMFLDTVNEIVWPYIESIIGEELYPTYTYSRLYQNGNILEPHTDKPECEVSITIQLGRSHHYSWPIFVDDVRYDLSEGDAVLYNGQIPHWRNECDGPQGYYSGQVFCHYVRANGKHAHRKGDGRWKDEIPFVRNRVFEMADK